MEVLKLLSPYAKVHHSRMRVTDLKEGSIIADVLVLPPVSQDGLTSRPDAIVDSRSAIANLKSTLETSGNSLATKLCDLAKGEDSCSVSLLSFGPAMPLPKVDKTNNVDKANDLNELFLYGVALLGVGLLFLSAVVVTCCLCHFRRKVVELDVEAGGDSKVEVDTSVSAEAPVAIKDADVIEKSAENASNVSTVTPEAEVRSDGSMPSVTV